MRLKNEKAAGPNGLATELFKTECNELVGDTHQRIYKIWLEKSMSSVLS